MTTTSQRASALIHPVPEHERPLSERYRVVAKDWVALDGAARLLEETKTAEASEAWKDFISKMVEARTAANLKKVQLEYIRMQFSEAQSVEATARHEARLSR